MVRLRDQIVVALRIDQEYGRFLSVDAICIYNSQESSKQDENSAGSHISSGCRYRRLSQGMSLS